MISKMIGTKLGMTRVYDETGVIHPATVVHVGGNVVTQVKTIETDGYAAVQLGYQDAKVSQTSKPLQGHFKKAGVALKRTLHEARGEAGDLQPGAAIAPDLFGVGTFVDVIGTTKGRGFQGVVRRWRMAGQPESHGSMMHRRVGAIGCRLTPGLTHKGKRLPGHMGHVNRTVQNLKVLQVRPEEGVLVIRGAVPGPNGGTVIVRASKKKVAAAAAK